MATPARLIGSGAGDPWGLRCSHRLLHQLSSRTALPPHRHSTTPPHRHSAALRLGRLVDAGAINLGCRLLPGLLHHRQFARDWPQPLGGRRHLAAA